MRISKISYIRRRYVIEADGKTYENLSALPPPFKEGEDVLPSEFFKFIKESEGIAAKDYLFSLLARGNKTESRAREKLFGKGFFKDAVDKAVELAKKYGYISDEAYAENYIQAGAPTKGRYRLKRELKERGVPDELIEEKIKSSELDEGASCDAMAERYMRGKTADEKTKKRLFAHLVMRGFSYENIKRTVRRYGIEAEE
jgi:Uncharacterized protein conserved in bacteria